MSTASPLDTGFSARPDATVGRPQAQAPLAPLPRRRAPASDPSALWVQITLCVVVAALFFAIIALPKVAPVASVSAVETGEVALRTALARLRSAIQAYRLDHCDWPGSTCDTDASAHRRFDAELFERHLTMCTDDAGAISAAPTASQRFGPYLDGPLPVDPVNGLATVRILDEEAPWPDRADGRSGWIYHPRSGELRAGCAGTTPGAGIRYYDL